MTNRLKATRPYLTAAVIIASIVGFYALDVFLARVESTEIADEAETFYRHAAAFEAKNQYDQAIPLYRRALTLDRNNREYQLSLARSLIAAKQFDRAKPILTGILERDPNDGRANLQMARLMSATGEVNNAISYYHRAIYGSWARGAQQRQTQVRLELIDLLSRQHRQRELLAEVLALEDLAGNDPELRPRVAGLFLEAGSPSRAAEAYRLLTREDPSDEGVFRGLGEAELQLGNYRAAQSAFVSALHRNPSDQEIRGRLALTTQLAQLDPTPRRLPWSEKLTRSRRVLSLAMMQLDQCAGSQHTDELMSLRQQAQEALEGKKRAAQDRVESNLSLAEQAWNYVRRACPALTKQPGDPLDVLMTRLEQEP